MDFFVNFLMVENAMNNWTPAGAFASGLRPIRWELRAKD